PPTKPVWPKPLLNGLAALMCGLLLGVAVAFIREYLDRAVRTRTDVHGSTGLSVIGLIPRMYRNGDGVVLIAKPAKTKVLVAQVSPPLPPAPPAPKPQPTRETYTFLSAPLPPTPEEPPVPEMARIRPPV